ncbi:D-alanyl-D-alanine carboxypeptidase, partial [bacterium]|nr:D-alanyl-D-alanine carboxypeptidase [bacterium]
MNKFLFIVLSFFILSSQVFATQISKYIKETGFSNETQVAVYIANLETKDILYKKNANKPLNPASGLKLLTLGTAYTVLGKNYNFETSLYEDEQNNIYLKLGGDVLLSQSDLEKLISNLKNKKIKN